MAIPLKFTISAPGKVILHGEHSVVYGYQAVAASLNLRSKVSYEVTGSSTLDDNLVTFSFPDVNMKLSLPIRSIVGELLKLPSGGLWDVSHPDKVEFDKLVEGIQSFIKTDPYLQTLTARQQQTATCCLFLMTAMLHDPNRSERFLLKPFILEFSSELPIGAGAGSSASFCVCLAAAFLFITGSYSQTQTTFSLSEHTKELISQWAFLGECIMHGKPSGLDNSICTYGSAIVFQRPNNISRIPVSCSLRVLLVDTKVSRQTRVLVENVAKLKDRHKDVIDHIMQAMDSISREASDLFKQMDIASSEDKQAEIFSRMGELWSMNHVLLKAIGVSHPSIERIIQLSNEHKLNGKLTGAGGGGFVIILIPPSKLLSTPVDSIIKSLVKVLEEDGFDVKDVELGGPGIQLH